MNINFLDTQVVLVMQVVQMVLVVQVVQVVWCSKTTQCPCITDSKSMKLDQPTTHKSVAC